MSFHSTPSTEQDSEPTLIKWVSTTKDLDTNFLFFGECKFVCPPCDEVSNVGKHWKKDIHTTFGAWLGNIPILIGKHQASDDYTSPRVELIANDIVLFEFPYKINKNMGDVHPLATPQTSSRKLTTIQSKESSVPLRQRQTLSTKRPHAPL